jgi:ribonuclease D
MHKNCLRKMMHLAFQVHKILQQYRLVYILHVHQSKNWSKHVLSNINCNYLLASVLYNLIIFIF